MEFEYELVNSLKKNMLNLKETSSQKKSNDNFKFFNDKPHTLSDEKFNYNNPTCRIISSLFTKDYRETLLESFDKIYSSNKKEKNNKKEANVINNDINNNNDNKIIKLNPINDTHLINYNIYNVKKNSIFHIKIYDKYIKYFPIFTSLTDYEKYISYNPLIESNQNFVIISNKFIHKNFDLKNYEITLEKFQNIKDKYIKNDYTKKNITFFSEIFKYLFEEIKINIGSIMAKNQCDEILKICAKLINDINEIVEEILGLNQEKQKETNNDSIRSMNNKESIIKEEKIKVDKINDKIINNYNDKFCIFNNNIIRKKFILNSINSKSIDYNFLEKEKVKENEESKIIELSEDKEKI